MRQYVLKRLLLVVPTLLLVSVIVFSLTRLIPGDVVVLMFEEKAYAEDLEALRAKLGLNRPIYVQYVVWLSQVVQGDLGESLWTKRPVLEEIARRLPVSAELGAMAIVFGLCMGPAHRGAGRDPAGHHEGLRGTQPGDHWACRCPGSGKRPSSSCSASIWFGWAPPLQFTPFTQAPWQHISQFILPAILLAIGSSASIMRLTRALMLEVLRQDYIRTAWSKGMRERRVVVKHALKNAVIPVVTIIGIEIGQVAGGTVVFETIFGLPGMGRFMLDAINQRDYPVVQGVNLLLATIIVFVNLLVDMTYAYLDPRIRYQ